MSPDAGLWTERNPPRPSATAIAVLLALSSLASGLAASAAAWHGAPPAPAAAQAPEPPLPAAVPEELPIQFEANVGQFPAEARFVGRAPGFEAWFADDRIAFASADGHTVVLRFAGADAAATATGGTLLPTTTSHFVGERSAWRTGVPNFGEVRYGALWPGIDAVFYVSPDGVLEFDFIVAPGADSADIRLAWEGHAGLEVDGKGRLAVATPGGSFGLPAPVLYQEGPAGREAVEGRFDLLGPSLAGFAVGPHDASRALVIDPRFAYSSFFGGIKADQAIAVDVDEADGSIYLAGNTFSTAPADQFPSPNAVLRAGANGAQNGWVARFAPDGRTPAWIAFLGASANSELVAMEAGTGSHLFVGGTTYGTFDFTGIPGYQRAPTATVAPVDADMYVMKIRKDGSTIDYATYLGGSNHDTLGAIAAQGDRLVVGGTSLDNDPSVETATDIKPYPTTANGYDRKHNGPPRGGTVPGNDMVLSVLDTTADGAASLLYSTYVGGAGEDKLQDIALLGNDILFTGSTGVPASSQPPESAADADAAVNDEAGDNKLKLTAGTVGAARLGLDDALVGRLKFSGPIGTGPTPGAATNAVLTVLGGTSTDAGMAIATVPAASPGSDYPIVVGSIVLGAAPTTPGAFDTTIGSYEGYVAKLDAGFTARRATYIGAGAQDYLTDVQVDSATGDVVVLTDTQGAASLPLVRHDVLNAYSAQSAGNYDLSIVRLREEPGGDFVNAAYSVYVGRSGTDRAFATTLVSGAMPLTGHAGSQLAIDRDGNPIIAALTDAATFTNVNAFQPTLRGNTEGVFLKLQPAPPLFTCGATTPRAITAGDVRLTAVEYARGTVVAAGDADVGFDFAVVGTNAATAKDNPVVRRIDVSPGGVDTNDYLFADRDFNTQVTAAAAGPDFRYTAHSSFPAFTDVVINDPGSYAQTYTTAPPVLRRIDGEPGIPGAHASDDIYHDADNNGKVSVGDRRLTAVERWGATPSARFAAATTVAAGDLDVGAVASTTPVLVVDRAPLGTVDAADDLYADLDASRTVSAGDLRLTPTETPLAGGAAVAAGDPDVGISFTTSVSIRRVDQAPAGFGPEDDIYADYQTGGTKTATGDYRYTDAGGEPAGTRIQAAHPDNNRDWAPDGPAPANPRIRRVDESPAAVTDPNDDLFADMNADNKVSVGDIRLSTYDYDAGTTVAATDRDVGVAVAGGLDVWRTEPLPVGADLGDDLYVDLDASGTVYRGDLVDFRVTILTPGDEPIPPSGAHDLDRSYTGTATQLAEGLLFDLDIAAANTPASLSTAYATVGAHRPALRITNGLGSPLGVGHAPCGLLDIHNRPPIPDLATHLVPDAAGNLTVFKGVDVAFTVDATDPDGSGIASFTLDAGEGAPYTDTNPTLPANLTFTGYTQSGPKLATLTVVDDDGGSSVQETRITALNRDPVAECVPLLHFTQGAPGPLAAGAGTMDPDGDPLYYSWDLDGDGANEIGFLNLSTASTPTVFDDTGTFPYGLTVWDDDILDPRHDTCTGFYEVVQSLPHPWLFFADADGDPMESLTVTEGDAVTVRLGVEDPLDSAATVTFATANGSAGPFNPWPGYLAPHTGVNVPAGATELSFTLATVDDEADQDDRTTYLAVVLPDSLAGAINAGPRLRLTVLDDDPAPDLVLGAPLVGLLAQAPEGTGFNRDVGVAVSLVHPTTRLPVPAGRDLVVSYRADTLATLRDPASGGDFLPASGTLTIPAGAYSAVFPLTLIGDAEEEPDEGVAVYVAFGPTLPSPLPAARRFTILDDDGPPDSALEAGPRLVADAGPDRPAAGGETLVLEALGDAGRAVGFRWVQVAGPQARLLDSTSPRLTVELPDVASPTTLRFQLTLYASDGSATSDEVAILLVPGASRIEADAGADQAVHPGDVVTLAGAARGVPGGEAATFSWTQAVGPAVALTANATSGTATFTAPNATGPFTDLVFTLTAKAGGPASPADAVRVRVLPLLPPPAPPPRAFTFDAGPDGVVAFQAPDVGAMAYAWDFGDGEVGQGIAVTHRYARPGTYTVRLDAVADDGSVESLTSEVEATGAASTLVAREPGTGWTGVGAGTWPSVAALAIVAALAALAIAASRLRPPRPAPRPEGPAVFRPHPPG